MEKRQLTVSYTYTQSGKEIPFIRLQGKWLKELGFEIGEKITVKEQRGLLVLALKVEGVEE
jgi:toxic protein SymE